MGRRRRRLHRILLNTAAAVLLLLSASGLILGTWTLHEPRDVTASRWTVATDRADRLDWLIWCGRGRVIIDRDHRSWWGRQLDEARNVANENRPGWSLAVARGFPWPIDKDVSTWAPIRLDATDLRFGTSTSHDRSASLSLWFLAAVSAAWPLARLTASVHRRRRGSRPAGRCGHCGYDLRATPDRCPECGTVAARRVPP